MALFIFLARRLRLGLLILAGLLMLPAWAQLKLEAASAPQVVTTEHVRAELLAHAPDGAAPGAPVWLGLQLTHQPGWHTYWLNPGDSGLPTTLTWTLPAGVEAGEIAWPLPRKIPIGNLANYGYEGTVLLAVPLTVTPAFKPPLLAGGSIDIVLHASWLVCRQECIPEEARLSLQLPIKGSTALHGAAFAAAQDAQPQDLAPASEATVDGQHLQLRVRGLPATLHGQNLGFFPETPGVTHTAAVAGSGWTQQWVGDEWQARIALAEHRSASPEQLPFVLTQDEGQRQAPPWGWRGVATVQGGWPAVAPAAQVSPALAAALQRNAANSAAASAPTPAPWPTLLLALAAALLGGLLLNLMPCVFPVLAIKVLGFTQHGSDSQGQRQRRLGGWTYTAGVLLSFWLLGGLLLALRAAGEQLGWGFQLQSPAMVASLALLFTLIGLNLAGMFEVGQLLPARLASLQARSPLLNDFLSGVLAVLVAAPCTAPFMGASLGLALGLPAWQALALFGALGLGLALPYLAASQFPVLAQLLPRPGPWMLTLRRLLAFPMFATVAWLVWVLGQQSGIDGVAALLALLVASSLLVWTLTLRGPSRWGLALPAALLTALLLHHWGPAIVQSPAVHATSDAAPAAASWQPWSTATVQTLTEQGRPVFVDFTAAWCVTCQYNKKTTLADPQVLADFAARNVALLRADWTRQDPAITAELTRLGRSGVPVYVRHAPGRVPQVFSEILDTEALRAALAQL